MKDPGHGAFVEVRKKAHARDQAHDVSPEDVKQPKDEERKMFLEWPSKAKYLSHRDSHAAGSVDRNRDQGSHQRDP
ncbi:MAG: hypothetical protein AAF517_02195 [Planctomycetota bacterium]